MSVTYEKAAYGMRVKVEDDCLHLIMDLETAEFIVGELPSSDEVTRGIARGVVAMACPNSQHVVAWSKGGSISGALRSSLLCHLRHTNGVRV